MSFVRCKYPDKGLGNLTPEEFAETVGAVLICRPKVVRKILQFLKMLKFQERSLAIKKSQFTSAQITFAAR
jgi:hypothetical protein